MRWTKGLVGLGLVVVLCVPEVVQGRMASSLSQRIGTITVGNNFSLYLGTSLGMENGDMTYTIRGPEDGGWRSKLEWPLDGVLYAGGDLSALVGERFQIAASIWKSLNDDAGTMKDSDWLDEYSSYLELVYGDDKAVYGEFDSTIDALQVDLNGQFAFLRGPNWALSAILGYAYTSWEWTAGDGFQRSPFRDFNVGQVSGTGIVYEETINVPYLGVSLSFTPMSVIGMNLYTLYSPIARCKDIDDHVLRFKKSTGETDGTFLSAGGELFWNFGGGFSLSGTVNYTTYDLEGQQDQVFYAGSNLGTRYEDIALTVTGSQVAVGLLFGYTL